MSIELELSNKIISTERPCFVMGILNATPDSFFEQSRFGAQEQGVLKALQMVEDGADIIDVGGESTRPGSEYVSEQEELNRVISLIGEIRKKSDVPISVDTRKYNVMKAAFENGADILNDISALEDSDEMAEFCAKNKIPVVLMHKKGLPLKMKENENYDDVFKEVKDYLKNRAQYAISCGIQKEKIIIDPGICFAKGLNENLEILKRLPELCALDFPVLIGLSRKSFIGEITGRSINERLSGTLAANLLCAIKGAKILRVHDVKETIDILNILRYNI